MEKNEEQKIWVTVSETINTGNYNSIKVEAGFSKVYKKKDDPIQLIEIGINDIESIIKTKAKAIRKKRKE